MEMVPKPLESPAPLKGRWAEASYSSGAKAPRLGSVHVIAANETGSASLSLSRAVYRAFEVAVAFIGLIVGLPLMLLAAAVVRLDSPGPVLFRHKRPARFICLRGRDLKGRSDLIPPPGGYNADAQYWVPSFFTLVKFRTMYSDARTRFPSYYAYKFSSENFHQQYPTIQDDPRVTGAGRLLRKLSIDELPNLWSVVKGDMALVGPRPEARKCCNTTLRKKW